MITAQIVCDVIQNYMGLCNDEIWIYNQRRKIPTDQRMYCVVGTINSRSYGNNRRIIETEDGANQEIYQVLQETIGIDLFSYDEECVIRMPELIGSFQSVYAQEVQEKHGMRFATQPMSIVDTSSTEGPAVLFKQTITMQVLRSYSKVMPITYFSEFSTEYDHS